MTMEPICITNAWNNFAEEDEGKGADLSNFGNEQTLQDSKQKDLYLNTVLQLIKFFPWG